MISKNTNKNGVKLLATVMVFAMVFAGVALVASDASSATENSGKEAKIGEAYYGSLQEALNTATNGQTVELLKDITTESVITFRTDGVTLNGNGHTISATKSTKFTGEWIKGHAGTIYVLDITSSVVINDLTVDSKELAFGVNVSTTDENQTQKKTVILNDVASKNSAGAGFVFGHQNVKATNLSASNYVWGGMNYDNGAVITIDSILEIGSAYRDSPTKQGTLTITDMKTGGYILFYSDIQKTEDGVVKIQTPAAIENTNALSCGAVCDSNGKWTYLRNELSLNGYDGSMYFSDDKMTSVELVGENKIKAEVPEGRYAIGGGDYIGDNGWISPSLTEIKGDKDAKLTMNISGGSGIIGSNLEIGDTNNKITLDITAGNRAIYGTTSLGFNNCEVRAQAGEMAIRVVDHGTLTLTNSKVTAELGAYDVNGKGDDDIFGTKVGGISVGKGSTLTTTGLRVVSDDDEFSNFGKIYVKGGYEQNPLTDVLPQIAGLYLNTGITGTGNAPIEVNKVSEPKDDDKAGLYLIGNAEYYGTVIVKEGDKEVGKTATAISTEEVEKAMNDDSVTTITITATKIDQNLTITKDVVFSSVTTITNGISLSLTPGASIYVSQSLSGDILNGNIRMKLNALRGDYKIEYGSIEVSGNLTSGSITLNGTENKIYGTIGGTVGIASADSNDGIYDKLYLSGDLTITGELTVGAGVVLVVPEGKTLYVNAAGGIGFTGGALAVYGDVVFNDSGSFSVTSGSTGAYAVAESGSITSEESSKINGAVKENILKFEGATGIDNTITGDTTWNTATYLNGALTINPDVTVTIGSKGYLDLCGNTLVIKGVLVISDNAYIVDSVGGGRILLADTGSIQNKGIIGKDSVVSVGVYDKESYIASGTVLMMNVIGVEFGLTKTVDKTITPSTTTYTLTVSGEVSKRSSDYELAIVSALIDTLSVRDLTASASTNVSISGSSVMKDGELTIASKATVGITNLTLETGAMIMVDGTLVGPSYVYMKNGAVAAVNGNASTITFSAKTGNYETYKNDKKTIAEDSLTSSSTVKVDGMNGAVIEVTSKNYTLNKEQWTEQMLNVHGSLGFVKTADNTKDGTLTITGNVYVPAGKELVLSDDKMEFGTTGTFITEGTIKAINEVTAYKGSSYSVETTVDSTKVETFYYTTFDNAYAAIADAVDKEITVMGGYTFSKEYTIGAEQEVVMTTGDYGISKDGKVTVSKEGTMTGNFVQASADRDAGIQGILVVMDGGSCTPVKGSYEVKSVDADGNSTYSGAAWAIENATAGSSIDIVGTVKFTEKVTVPEGVTVNVGIDAVVKANGGLGVDGTIINKGTIEIAKDKNVDVAGSFVNSDGTVRFDSDSGSRSEMDVTGSFIGTAIGTVKINAAKYLGDDNVYTSVSKAVAAVSAMDVPVDITVLGKFTEAADLSLDEGMKIVISAGADVTITSIRLAANAVLDIDGTLTADIIGAVGKADTTGAVTDSIVDLNKVKDVEFKLSYNESNMTSTMTMTLGGYEGAIKFIQGDVTVETTEAVVFGEGKTMAVGSEATVTLSKGHALTDSSKKYFSNEGTIKMNETTSFTGILGGEVVVKEDQTLTLNDKTEVVGTITLSEKSGKVGSVNIAGEVRIGSTPGTLGASGSISGKVTFGAGGYVIVFEGSTFNSTEDDVEKTSYYVNGIALATIYTTQTDIGISKMDDVVHGLRDLDIIDTEHPTPGSTVYKPISWASEGEKVTGNVGDFDAVSTTIGYNTVEVKISAGPGLQVYVDDIKADTEEDLVIGTHTITVYFLPNYEGTPVVKFNGVTISDNSFTITADMMYGENKIVVTGATYVEPSTSVIPVPTPATPADDGEMGLTEYLLIVLVVLAAILVVVVAIRMMRS